MIKIILYLVSLLVIPLIAESIHHLFFDQDMGKYRLLMIIGFYISNTIAIGLSEFVTNLGSKIRTSSVHKMTLYIIIYEVSYMIILKFMGGWSLMCLLSVNIAYVLGILGYFGLKWYLKKE